MPTGWTNRASTRKLAANGNGSRPRNGSSGSPRKNSTDYDTYTYENLLDFGRRAAANEGEAKIHLHEEMWLALKKNPAEFWKNWSVVTGLPSPSMPEDRGFHRWVCCSHQIYYWFGPPIQKIPT